MINLLPWSLDTADGLGAVNLNAFAIFHSGVTTDDDATEWIKVKTEGFLEFCGRTLFNIFFDHKSEQILLFYPAREDVPMQPFRMMN